MAKICLGSSPELSYTNASCTSGRSRFAFRRLRSYLRRMSASGTSCPPLATRSLTLRTLYSGLSRQMKKRSTWNPLASATLIAVSVQLPDSVVSIAKLAPASEIFRCPPEHLSAGRERCAWRQSRIEEPGYSVRFKKIFPALKTDQPDQAAFSGAVRPRKKREDCHDSDWRLVQLTDYAVISVARRPGNKTNFKLTPARFFHHVDVPFRVVIEDRYTRL